jgi:hypothetical protein
VTVQSGKDGVPATYLSSFGLWLSGWDQPAGTNTSSIVVGTVSEQVVILTFANGNLNGAVAATWGASPITAASSILALGPGQPLSVVVGLPNLLQAGAVQFLNFSCPGGASSSSSLLCRVCRPGTRRTEQGMCEECTAGQYSPDPNATKCLPCPSGESSTRGMSHCERTPFPLWGIVAPSVVGGALVLGASIFCLFRARRPAADDSRSSQSLLDPEA